MALLQQLVEKKRLSFQECLDGYHIGYTKMGMISNAWNSYFFLGFLLFPPYVTDGWREGMAGYGKSLYDIVYISVL
jgi:hypothetical protein